ncbi:hypothetical protein HID58_009304 [Brassica napus]|uniref:Uncharacterized protein n=1 Tax=Brassica napus TaxID=3708 RepID=A0ABQ8DS45_BRANA|nr:hypothetical protein HID58_009304 [Brassica napus]
MYLLKPPGLTRSSKILLALFAVVSIPSRSLSPDCSPLFPPGLSLSLASFIPHSRYATLFEIPSCKGGKEGAFKSQVPIEWSQSLYITLSERSAWNQEASQDTGEHLRLWDFEGATCCQSFKPSTGSSNIS